MSNLAQMEDNRSYMEDFPPLTDEETAMVQKAAKIIMDQTAVLCTGCSYCTEGCPQHLPIRDYLKQVSADLDK